MARRFSSPPFPSRSSPRSPRKRAIIIISLRNAFPSIPGLPSLDDAEQITAPRPVVSGRKKGSGDEKGNGRRGLSIGRRLGRRTEDTRKPPTPDRVRMRLCYVGKVQAKESMTTAEAGTESDARLRAESYRRFPRIFTSFLPSYPLITHPLTHSHPPTPIHGEGKKGLFEPPYERNKTHQQVPDDEFRF